MSRFFIQSHYFLGILLVNCSLHAFQEEQLAFDHGISNPTILARLIQAKNEIANSAKHIAEIFLSAAQAELPTMKNDNQESPVELVSKKVLEVAHEDTVTEDFGASSREPSLSTTQSDGSVAQKAIFVSSSPTFLMLAGATAVAAVVIGGVCYVLYNNGTFKRIDKDNSLVVLFKKVGKELKAHSLKYCIMAAAVAVCLGSALAR